MSGRRASPQPQQGAISSQSTSAPWPPAQRYLKDIYARAKNQYVRNMDLGQGFNQAQNYFKNVVGGNYLTGGEGFNQALNAAKNQIIPLVESRFSRGGRLNSGLARTSEASGIGDAFAKLYGNERQLQQGAAGALPGLSEQLSPYGRLSRYASLIGNPQSSSATGYGKQYFPGNRVAGTLGGILGGGMLGSSLGSAGGLLAGTAIAPWLAPVGAIAGGLSGGFL